MSQSTIDALLSQSAKALFLKATTSLKPRNLVVDLATVAPSTARSEDYGWLGQTPQMEEAGSSTSSGSASLPIKALSETSYTILNKKFWTGIAVDHDDWADDQLGGLSFRVGQLAETAMKHRNKLLVSMLTGGTTNTCYDGSAFFGDSHPARKDEGGVQDNLLAGSGITTAAVATDFDVAIGTMLGFIAENGEPFHEGASDFVVMAPTTLRKPMLEAVAPGSTLISNTTNVQIDGLNIKVIFDARLNQVDVSDWYLLHTGGFIKPFIFQDREPITIENTQGGDMAVTQEQYIFKVRARYNVGYGFWQNAIKMVNS